jgi:isopenicillin-N epimerase
MTTRRDFLTQAGVVGAVTAAAPAAALAAHAEAPPVMPPPPRGAPAEVARNESYWRQVAAQYRVTDKTTNMEAGYFGMMAQPVLAAYHAHIDRVNRESSYFARRDYPRLSEDVRARVAEFIGASPREVAFSRNATESLQTLIGQYNRVGAGDAVLFADLDYPAMQAAMRGLAERRGASAVMFDIPEPATREGVLSAYDTALAANPRTRLLLLTHCNNKTGLILPVREIAQRAHARGVEVVVDAAHSFGQVPLMIADLDADFVGLNLHKWIGAPVGVAALYIRADRFDRIDPAHGNERGSVDTIDTRIATGTTNFAAVMTIPDALDFQARIGVLNKAARLRYLRDRWVSKVRGVPGVTVLAPDDAELVGAITGVRMHGRGGRAENVALVKTLVDEFGLFTHWRTGLAKGDCVRITPALYNSVADADKMSAALTTIAARG